MSTIAIFGGSGKVAKHLTRLLTTASPPHKVYSIIRSNSHVPEIEALGGVPVLSSIEDTSTADMVSLLRKLAPDVVVWSAGAGAGNPERTKKVDFEGAVRAMDAVAEVEGLEKFVMVSAVDVRDRENREVPVWYDEDDRERSDGMWSAIPHYMQAKLQADRSLVTENGRRKLKYTIVRPGRLSDDTDTGKVNIGKVHIATSIPRKTVAKTIFEVVKQNAFNDLAFDVLGGETPVPDAVSQVVKDKVDTFEGHY